MAGRRLDGLRRDVEVRRDGDPGMPGPVHGDGREAEPRGDVLQDVVHLRRPVARLRVGVQRVEEVVLPGHPPEDLPALRLHLDRVRPRRLRPPVLQAAVHDVGGVEEVLGVHPDQEEAGEEEVHVLPLPFGELGEEQLPQHLGGQGALAGRLVVDLVDEEGIVLGEVALAGVVEHGADVPVVDVPGVLLRGGLRQEGVEAVHPSDVDVGECEALGLGVEGEDPGDGREVDLLRARLQLRLGGVGAHGLQEAGGLVPGRRQLVQDPVPDLPGAEAVQLPLLGEPEADVDDVHPDHVGGLLDRGGLRFVGGLVPVGGEEPDAGGDVGDGAVDGD